MGGPGQPPDSIREMSEIENALLDQAVQLILGEWCSHWTKSKELKPVLLGFETNGKFIQQTAPPETVMLVITLGSPSRQLCGANSRSDFPTPPWNH